LDSEECPLLEESQPTPFEARPKAASPSLPSIAELEFPDLLSIDPNERLRGFERLYRTYIEQEVRRVAKKYPGLPEDIVVDSVSDAFLALWKDVSEFGWNAGWTWAYLRKIANNKAFRAHKKLVFRSQFVVVPSEGVDRESNDTDGDTDTSDVESFAETRNPVVCAVEDGGIRLSAENHELMEKVYDAIERFSPRLKSVGRIMAANFHMRLTPEALLVLYFDSHKEMLTIDAAAKALSVVRSRLAEVLFRHRRESEPA
jgi:DNA-directed RNA polymerase specialized sigma24 family protein